MPIEIPRQPDDPSSGPASTTVALLERAVVLLLCAGLLVGVLQVLRPFTTAILFGAILAIAAWPLRDLLIRKGIRRGLAATLLLLLALGVVLVPVLALAPGLAIRMTAGAHRLEAILAAAPDTPPDWLGRVPLAGDRLSRLWGEATRTDGDLRTLIEPYSDWLRETLIGVAQALADSLLQLILALIVATMLWINGDVLGEVLRDVLRRLGGETAARALDAAAGSVRGVAYGVVGTAVLQTAAMALGLMLAGVPGAALLAFITLLLALSQIGAPLIIVIGLGAAWWLFQQDAGGWSAFMVAWALLVGFGDNVVRPWPGFAVTRHTR